MQPHICVFIAVAFMGSLSLHVTAEDARNEHDMLEAASLMEAFAANLESIRSFDVAIETTRSRHEEGMSAFEEEIVRERLVVDENQQLGMRARSFEIRRFRPGQDSEPLITTVIAEKQIGNRVGQRHYPKPVQWLDLSGAKTFAWASHYPDLRFIGATAYPMPSASLLPAVTESILRIGRSPLPGMKMRIMPEQRALIVNRKNEGGDGARVTHNIFDLKNSLLLSIRVMRETKNEAETKPTLSERYEWKQIGDVFVPESIAGEVQKFVTDPDGKQVRWIEQYDVSFRWLAVNSGIVADKSGDGILNDPNDVLKFVTAEGKPRL